MSATTTVHACPWCRCLPQDSDDPGPINRDAPGYPLVELIDSLSAVHRRPPPRAAEDGT